MTATTTSPPDAAADGPLLLPSSPPRLGPESRRLLGRLAVTLLMWQVVAAALIVVGGETATAAGVSMVFPGAGLLYVASPLLFLGSLVALLVALVLWWGVSAHVAIPFVWAGSGVVAIALVDGPRWFVDRGTTWAWAVPVAYTMAVGTVGFMVWRVEQAYRRKLAKVPELNEYLQRAELPERITARRELDDMDAELLRWAYAFAFQPEDGLDGLDWGEQFHGGTQLRYQLNSLTWAMTLYAANHLPNAPAQITKALETMVRKHTDLRVWKYWRTLNLVGNFDSNPDPIRRDNIMFSAFLGDVINSVEAATGTDTFDKPGSLEFVWLDGRTFSYDHHTLAEAVQRNFERSRLGFFPCEPGWSFTVCNVMGAQALHGHDVAHGTDTWPKVRDRWTHTLDHEYLTPDGSYAHIRSNHVGLSWDTGEVPGGHYFANGTHRFVDILPDHARRARALELRGAAPKMAGLSAMVRDGRLDLDLPAELERHRTRRSKLLPWIKIIGGARLVGDARLVDAAIRSSAEKCATGKQWPDRPVDGSASATGSYMLLRWSAPLDLAALNMRGFVAPVGPILAATDWDSVLVTEAVCDDGSTLELSMRPVGTGTVPAVDLLFASLVPGGRYALEVGDEPARTIVADDSGRATATIDLTSAIRARLRPEASA
jgi:Linalool dehydratase/isomerase